MRARPVFLLSAHLLLIGCSAPRPPDPPVPPAPASSSAAPQQPPAQPPAPLPLPAAVVETGPLPAGIPRDALAYRDRFIRIWRFYFALAQPHAIGFAQVHQESRWKPLAASKYASGLAQFTPATARDYAGLLPDSIRATCPATAGCPTEPTWALYALSLYDYRLYGRFPWAETTDDRWRLALAAYNGGSGWLTRERVKAGNSARWADIAAACIRNPDACKENKNYPVVILERWLPLYRQWLRQ